MKSVRAIADFVGKLTALTDKDKLEWEEECSGHRCSYKGVDVYICWLSGDRPSIAINKSGVEGYGYGLEALVSAIFCHYKRAKKGAHSDLAQKELKESQEQLRIDHQKTIDDAAAEIDKITKKKKPR